MRNGDKCLCLVDDVAPATVQDQLEGPATRSRPHRVDQLNVDVASSVYLQSGRFSVEHMTSFLATSLSEATERFPLLRAAGEMSWVLPMPIGADDFFVYESAVNDIVADAPAIFMCLYDLQRFSAQMLVDILHTHPQVLLDDNLIDNRHYLPPAEYLARRRPSDRTLAAPKSYPLATVSPPSARAGDRDRWTLADRSRDPCGRARGQRYDEPLHRRDIDHLAAHGRRAPQTHVHEAGYPLPGRAHRSGDEAPLAASLGFQERVDLADRDRALADGGGDALDRATAHVAHGEHALAAGLEHAVVAVGGGSGEHVPLRVQRDLPLKPTGVGGRTDQHEQGCRRNALLLLGLQVVQHHLFERFVSDELARPRCCARS